MGEIGLLVKTGPVGGGCASLYFYISPYRSRLLCGKVAISESEYRVTGWMIDDFSAYLW